MTGRPLSSLSVWWPSAAMMLCSFLSYFDRQILAALAPLILKDTGLSTQSYGAVISAFSIAYMLGNPVWGTALDRMGLRNGMSVAVGIWTAASAAHSALTGFIGFAVARSVLGFGEGATFPGGMRTAMESLPPDKQSRGMALAYSGGSLGAIVTPVIAIPLAVAFGWRFAFLITGLAGLLWIVMWRTTVRVPETAVGNAMWPDLRERRFWSLVASYGLGALPIGPVLYLAPLYLNRALGVPQADLAKLLWIPPLGWESGYFFWGWFTDRFLKDNRRPVRAFAALATAGLPLVLIPQLRSPLAAVALFFWTMFIAAGFIVISLRAAALAYAPGRSALVAGIGAGSWSAFVAVMLPMLGRLFDMHYYSAAFWLTALCPMLGTLLFLFLTRRDSATLA